VQINNSPIQFLKTHFLLIFKSPKIMGFFYFKKDENHPASGVDEADINKSLAGGECTERNREPWAPARGYLLC